MALIDKAREAAAQAQVVAEQGLAQVQARIDDLQAKRHQDALFRELGAAYYAKKRSGGSAEAVKAALAAVDAHIAAAAADEAEPAADAGPAADKPAADGPAAPTGGYGLDDI